jgi:hypothetical protein
MVYKQQQRKIDFKVKDTYISNNNNERTAISNNRRAFLD